MKKKGNRKRVSKGRASRKRRGFFSFLNDFFRDSKVAPVVLSCIFVILVALVSLLTTTGGAVNESTSFTGHSFLDSDPNFNWLKTVPWLDVCATASCTWRDIIIYIVVLGIIFAMLYDILTMVSIFQNGISAAITGGMAIIASLIGFIKTVAVWLVAIGAGLGVLAGFAEIFISIVIFFGLAIGNYRIARWAAKRKGQALEVRAIKSAGEAGAAMTGLRTLEQKFNKSKP